MGNFLAKWILNGVITAPLLLWFAGVPLLTGVLASTGLSLLAWIVGDNVILRSSNNTVATISDLLLAGVYLWLAARALHWDLGLGELLVVAVVLAVAEWGFHRYFLRDEAPSSV